ncbi:MAG: hypothetical protein PHE36_12965 [Novosphingobium sp.]|nr:hypothetical protein [Novosphingobium sp.]
MTGSGGQGWLTTLADLAIILFMVTATDLSNAGPPANDPPHMETGAEAAATIATAEPVAIFRPGGAVSLDTWLADQAADGRQRLTILVRHSGKSMEPAMAEGLKLMRQAEQAGQSPRLIVEEGEHPDVTAVLAYDSDPRTVARNLRSPDQETRPEENR